MMSNEKQSLITVLQPVARLISLLDLNNTEESIDALNHAFAHGWREQVAKLVAAGAEEGWLTPKKATDTLSFGRITKPVDNLNGCSLDAVDMEGEGAAHTHPKGEVSLCIPVSGAPVFEGVTEGWAVLAPNSTHTPTVTGGRMRILYFLPDGEVTWS